MPFYAGKNGSLSVGGTAYPMDTWSLSIDVDEVEVTNFQSAGQKSLIAGIAGGAVSASGPYNGAAPSAGSLASFTFGLASGVTLGSTSYQVLITSVKVDTTVKEKATIEVTGSLAANLG
jgi:hypothetical protein